MNMNSPECPWPPNSTAQWHIISPLVIGPLEANFHSMPLTLALKKMSHADKLRAMEALWNDLAKNEDRFESPAWHGEALQEAQHLVKAGKAKFSDWEDAKARLRRKIAKVA